MFVSTVSNMQFPSNKKPVSSEKSNVAFKGYYYGGWEQRKLDPQTLKEINAAAEKNGVPKEFVKELIGASKGSFYNPTLEEDFVFSPKNIIDILNSYQSGKQKKFDYLSNQQCDMADEERFTGDQMRDMYLAASKVSLATLKNLVQARNNNGYLKYSGTEIARKMQEK